LHFAFNSFIPTEYVCGNTQSRRSNLSAAIDGDHNDGADERRAGALGGVAMGAALIAAIGAVNRISMLGIPS
jgi:hypothetical protein